MSGSGSDPVITCDRLGIETAISSPEESVIKSLQAGDVLRVGLEDRAGTTIVALYSDGQKAGCVEPDNINRLRECLREGTQYDATVISRSGELARVHIKPIGK